MFNLRQANAAIFPIKTPRGIVHLNEEQIGNLIKKKLSTNKAIRSVFDDFDISPEHLSKLVIRIVDLEDRYAETDEQFMSLDRSLFEDGNFFEDKFFIVAHEIVHWLTRVKESRAYFEDEEERQGFVLSVAYELSVGTDIDTIWNRIYPKVEFHFHNNEDARQFFENLVHKAKKILSLH